MLLKLDWEIWLDSNLSPIIAKWLKDETGLNVKSAYVLNIHGLDDIDIYKLARNNSIPVIIISKDSDLAQLINRLGSPPKLINLKVGNTGNKILFNFILLNIEEVLKRLIDDDAHIADLLY